MRDYGELVKALQLCPNTCRGCPRLNTSEPFTECKAKLNRDAADAIEELLAELTTIRKQLPRWISVEEGLPKYEGYYSVFDGVQVADCYFEDGWFIAPTTVTHWMHLPAPPKGVE